MGGPSRNGRRLGYGDSTVTDLLDVSSEKARKDMTALMIGVMFYHATASKELMQETMIHLREDPERMEGVIGSLLGIFYAYVTSNDTQPLRWKTIVDHLCNTLNLDVPEA